MSYKLASIPNYFKNFSFSLFLLRSFKQISLWSLIPKMQVQYFLRIGPCTTYYLLLQCCHACIATLLRSMGHTQPQQLGPYGLFYGFSAAAAVGLMAVAGVLCTLVNSTRTYYYLPAHLLAAWMVLHIGIHRCSPPRDGTATATATRNPAGTRLRPGLLLYAGRPLQCSHPLLTMQILHLLLYHYYYSTQYILLHCRCQKLAN